MRRLGYINILTLSCCLIISCAKKCAEPTPNFVYFNSFESAADTTGWHGITREMLVGDPAPGGGNRSLHIGGGCVQPTAYLDLLPHDGSGYYTISCWGKAAEPSGVGNIVLTKVKQNGEREEIELRIEGANWTFRRSRDFLYCPANCKLRIEILIGGIVGAHMFVDCIGIEKVK